MGKTIGIDLGTTNSCMAVMEGGEPTVIPNREGARTTPSVVALSPGGRLVGSLAKRQAVTNPRDTIASVKRFMGRSGTEVTEEDEQSVSYEMLIDERGVRIRAGGSSFSPPEISAMVLQKMKEDAEAYLGEEVTGAIITVPAYFNDAQRQATKDAGRIAGLFVQRIINEPTAAALAYGLDRHEPCTVLVVDLGGGTFDVSVLDIGNGVIEVQATAGDNRLGGDDFDRVIVEWLLAGFEQQFGRSLREDSVALQRLFEAAEKAKCDLSTKETTSLDLPFLTVDTDGKPLHLSLPLTRDQLNGLCQNLIARLDEPINNAISDAKEKGSEQIDKVVFVGGMTRMPAVRDRVNALCPVPTAEGVNPDEVVAVGAAIQAGVMTGEVKDFLLLDVIPLTLSVETRGGVAEPIIERNSTIPTRRTKVFSTTRDNQTRVALHIVQGERQLAEHNKSLGMVVLDRLEGKPRGMTQIEVTFDIDADGLLQVDAHDVGSGRHQHVAIEASSGLSEDEIQQMVAAARKNARSDRTARAEVERRNRAEAMAASMRERIAGLPDATTKKTLKAVEQLERRIDDAEPSELDELVEGVKQAYYEILATDEYKQLQAQQQAEEEEAAAAAAAQEAAQAAPIRQGGVLDEIESMMDIDGELPPSLPETPKSAPSEPAPMEGFAPDIGNTPGH